MPHHTERALTSARAVVLGEVIDALNAVDGRDIHRQGATVTAYRDAVRDAMTPIGSRTPPPLSAAPAPAPDAGADIISLWPRP